MSFEFQAHRATTRAGLLMTAGRRRGLCAPGPRLPGTTLSAADSAVDAAAAAALRARIAAAFDTFRARVCRRRRVCTCAGIPSDRKAFASRYNGVSCACEAARLPPAMKPPVAHLPGRPGRRSRLFSPQKRKTRGRAGRGYDHRRQGRGAGQIGRFFSTPSRPRARRCP